MDVFIGYSYDGYLLLILVPSFTYASAGLSYILIVLNTFIGIFRYEEESISIINKLYFKKGAVVASIISMQLLLLLTFAADDLSYHTSTKD
jgi:hypothetical protein